ncbi:MAG: DNA damage-inducible protein D [Chloroflexi bacterium]|nr:DNA damage-inducible protein D [Chloroflexota bacterium]
MTNDIDSTNALAEQDASEPRQSPFDQLRRETEEGVEYWSARDLAKILGYTQYDKFRNALQKAMTACENSGHDIADHFEPFTNVAVGGKGARQRVEDIRLSRYACYLTVQNADPTKPLVSMGQTYFAVQTRRAEAMDLQIGTMTEDERRLFLRDQVSKQNRRLAETANLAGVESRDFGIFQDHGYMGLYGGLRSGDIHRRKGLKPSEHILDRMASEELAANYFRATQAEAKLRRDDIQGKHAANRTHYQVGREVRETIVRLGGTLPEDVPTPDTDIRQLKRAAAKRLKKAEQSQQSQQSQQLPAGNEVDTSGETT